MTHTISAPEATATGSSCDAKATKTLLAYGVLAGPLYLLVGAIQGVTRDGFDISKHQGSLLSNGDLGWIQITNFVLTGLMTVAAAIGIRRALRSGRGATWGPRLIATFGLGMVGAGVFVADPMNGFPIGTPDGAPVSVSWHGMLHLVVGALAFLALTGGCIAIARRFASLGHKGWARYSAVTGVALFAAFAGIASGSGAAVVNLAFAASVVNALLWIGALARHLYQRA